MAHLSLERFGFFLLLPQQSGRPPPPFQVSFGIFSSFGPRRTLMPGPKPIFELTTGFSVVENGGFDFSWDQNGSHLDALHRGEVTIVKRRPRKQISNLNYPGPHAAAFLPKFRVARS